MKSSIKLSLMSTYLIHKILTSRQGMLNGFIDEKMNDGRSVINIEKILLKTSKDEHVYFENINRLEVLSRMYQVLLSQKKNADMQKIEEQILEILC